MARHIRSEAVRPALVLCSSALRAHDTLDALRPALGQEADVHIDPDLYGATARQLINRIRTVGHDIASVMIIGHNPGLHDLAIELAGDGDEAAISRLHAKFPTGALATLDVGRIGWDELGPGQAYLTSLVLPRDLA